MIVYNKWSFLCFFLFLGSTRAVADIIVKKGDCLSVIVHRHYRSYDSTGDWRAYLKKVVRLNPHLNKDGKSINWISPGQKIILPEIGPLERASLIGVPLEEESSKVEKDSSPQLVQPPLQLAPSKSFYTPIDVELEYKTGFYIAEGALAGSNARLLSESLNILRLHLVDSSTEDYISTFSAGIGYLVLTQPQSGSVDNNQVLSKDFGYSLRTMGSNEIDRVYIFVFGEHPIYRSLGTQQLEYVNLQRLVAKFGLIFDGVFLKDHELELIGGISTFAARDTIPNGFGYLIETKYTGRFRFRTLQLRPGIEFTYGQTQFGSFSIAEQLFVFKIGIPFSGD